MGRKQKGRRQPEENRHHLLFQRKHWDRDGYALALRNRFIYTMKVGHHNQIHANLHDVPLPPRDDLERLAYMAEADRDEIAKLTPRQACIWLADHSDFEPFKACMRYQAELIGGR